jgi:tetratricopeptide (TPR) repeat protein
MTKRILLFLIVILAIQSCKIQRETTSRQVYNSVGPFLHYYEGIQNRLYGDYFKAIKNLEQSLELYGDNDAIYYELAICYNLVNEIERAINFLEKAKRLNPNNESYLTLLSILYINERKIDKAIENQLQLVKIDDTNPSYLFQLALLYSEKKLFEDALNIINLIEHQVGFNNRLIETKIRIFIDNNQLDSALAQVDLILQIDSENALANLYKSDIFFKKGEDSLAFVLIKKTILGNPEFPQARIELYQRYLEVGETKSALDLLQGIVESNLFSREEKVRMFYPLLFDKGAYVNYKEQIISIIEKLRVKYPETHFIHEVSFEHFLRINDLNSAREALQILTILEENNSERWEKLISFDYSLNKKEKVIHNSIKASKLFPEKSIFYIFQAIVLDELKDIDNAILVLEEGVGMVTNSEEKAEMYGTLGDMYYKTNKFDKSFKTYETSLKWNPNNARVLNNYSYYLSLNKFNLKKALEMSTKAVDLDPNNSTFIDTKGWVLFKMEKYEEARDVLRNAIAKSGSESAVINEHYGDALYKTGNKESAYIYWLKAKEIGGGSEILEEKIRTKSYVP